MRTLNLAHLVLGNERQVLSFVELSHNLADLGIEITYRQFFWGPDAWRSQLQKSPDPDFAWVIIDTGWLAPSQTNLPNEMLEDLERAGYGGGVIVLAPKGSVSLDAGGFEVAILSNDQPNPSCDVSQTIAQAYSDLPVINGRNAIAGAQELMRLARLYPDVLEQHMSVSREKVDKIIAGDFPDLSGD